MGKGKGRGEGSGGMLQAQKNALRATLTENVIKLQEQELTYFYNNFSNISTMAAIIGGFAFSGLTVTTAYTGWLADLNTETKIIVCEVRETTHQMPRLVGGASHQHMPQLMFPPPAIRAHVAAAQ